MLISEPRHEIIHYCFVLARSCYSTQSRWNGMIRTRAIVYLSQNLSTEWTFRASVLISITVYILAWHGAQTGASSSWQRASSKLICLLYLQHGTAGVHTISCVQFTRTGCNMSRYGSRLTITWLQPQYQVGSGRCALNWYSMIYLPGRS